MPLLLHGLGGVDRAVRDEGAQPGAVDDLDAQVAAGQHDLGGTGEVVVGALAVVAHRAVAHGEPLGHLVDGGAGVGHDVGREGLEPLVHAATPLSPADTPPPL